MIQVWVFRTYDDVVYFVASAAGNYEDALLALEASLGLSPEAFAQFELTLDPNAGTPTEED